MNTPPNLTHIRYFILPFYFVIGVDFSGPTDIIAFRDQIVQMHCEPINFRTSSYVWLIDGTTIANSGIAQYISIDGDYTITIRSAEIITFKRFQCAILINGDLQYSDNATIRIQGTYTVR